MTCNSNNNTFHLFCLDNTYSICSHSSITHKYAHFELLSCFIYDEFKQFILDEYLKHTSFSYLSSIPMNYYNFHYNKY